VEALKAVEEELRPLGFGLKVFDGYRPYRVTVVFYEAYHDSNFVASPYTGSRHNRGCAVDLTLIDLKTGKEPVMPTPYDSFTKEAAADYAGATPAALLNRQLLQKVMLKHGFVLYPSEWWHFDFGGWKDYPVMDIPFEDLIGEQK
jgi:D-alanyl-D-alanine dipeptidase